MGSGAVRTVLTVVVPSVVGQTQGAAVSQLTKLGLKPKLQNVASQQPAGVVVAQKPPASTKVDKGATVTLNISKGTGSGGNTTTTVQTTTTGTVTTAAHATNGDVSYTVNVGYIPFKTSDGVLRAEMQSVKVGESAWLTQPARHH